MCGGIQDADVMRFSTSAELIHTMALIHDDIIDKGDLRHNTSCFHIFAQELYSAANAQQHHSGHLGISQAILAGDLIFSRAYDVIYSSYTIPAPHLVAAQQHMQAMIEEVTAGQMIDVDTMGSDEADLTKLDAKNYYKSGAYTFCRPLVTGALLAGADKKTCSQREKIGTLLGKAYQMRDDILDVLIADGDDTTTYDNKTKFSDVQDGQQTYLTHYIYEHGTYAQRLALSQAMGKRLSSSQIKHLRDIFQDS
jgi:geranylgeranyl diphosphate synthase, type I